MSENSKLRNLVRSVIKEEILLEQDEVVDVSGLAKEKTRSKLKKGAEELEEELGKKMFGRRIVLSGIKKSGEKVKNVEGVVSEVNVFINDDYHLDVKVSFKEAGDTFYKISNVKIIDTMGVNRKSSHYYI